VKQYGYTLYRRGAAKALPKPQRGRALQLAQAMEALERTVPDSIQRERAAQEARAAAADFYALVDGATFKVEGEI